MAAVLAVLACGAPAARAQTLVARPYHAVFEGAAAEPGTKENLDLSVSLAEAYDDNREAEVAGGPGGVVGQTSGFFTAVNPQMVFNSRKGRVLVSATAGSAIRYYRDLHEVLVMNHTLGAGVSAQITRQTTLLVNQAVSYAPAFLYGLFATDAAPTAGAVIPAATDYALNTEHSYAYATAVNLTQTLTSHATVSFSSGYRVTDFVGNAPGFLNLSSYDAGGRLTYSLDRNVKLRFGYTYEHAEYAPGLQPSEHDLNIGVEYNRPLSPTRATTVGFTLGPAVANGPLQQIVATQASDYQYHLAGDAFWDYQMGRTWSARANLHRGVAYIQGLPGPVFASAATLATGGFLDRRTDVQATAGYSSGNYAGLVGAVAPYTTYTGDVRLRYGMTKLWAGYVEYLYYFYNFSKNLPLPPALAPGLSRNGVRVGLTLWVPVRRR